jgi:RNA polymerase sigma factor for flagellar operon FliA
MDLVRYCAKRLHSKLPGKVELDDLISAGIFGLLFETYCTARIKGSIPDELRSMDWVPRLVRARVHQLAKIIHSLEMHRGRSPDEEEIAEELNMDIEEFNRLKRDASAFSLVSLNNKYDDNGEKDVCEIDVIDKKSTDPVIEAQKRDLKNLLTKGLTRAERLIIVLYYYEKMTMKEIGATLDLSESRVYQMHSLIVEILKNKLLYKNEDMIICQLLLTEKVLPKQIIKVVDVVNIEFINYLKKHPKALYEIKPRQFEELIAEILTSYGWQIQLTPPIKDGGYDIFAISKDLLSGVKTSWIIECKKYSPENKVSVDIVRALYGIKSNLRIANALIATTSYFTKGANDFKASRYDIELKDYKEILEWINQYRPNPNGKLYIKNNQLIISNKDSVDVKKYNNYRTNLIPLR